MLKKEWIMKKQKDKITLEELDDTDDLQDHYNLDYSKAKPNRFVERIGQDSLMVVLDPDVAAVFSTPEAVNETLRAIAGVVKHLPKQKA